jgi:hypothetical protein
MGDARIEATSRACQGLSTGDLSVLSEVLREKEHPDE